MDGRPLQPHGDHARRPRRRGRTTRSSPTFRDPRSSRSARIPRADPTSVTARRPCPPRCRRSSATSPLEVTATTTNDYDALVALQTWFRSAEFRYSLDAPVEEGFDGSRHRRGGEIPRGARGLLHPLRIGVRADGPHARDAEPHRRRIPARRRDQRRDRPRDRVLRLERSAARMAGGAVRGHRLGAVRADQRPRRPDDLHSRRVRSRAAWTTPPLRLPRRARRPRSGPDSRPTTRTAVRTAPKRAPPRPP